MIDFNICHKKKLFVHKRWILNNNIHLFETIIYYVIDEKLLLTTNHDKICQIDQNMTHLLVTGFTGKFDTKYSLSIFVSKFSHSARQMREPYYSI